MSENNGRQRMIFRVFAAYKRSMLIGFFIGVSLVMVVILVGQVVGKEIKPLNYVRDQIGFIPRDIDVPTQTSDNSQHSLEDSSKTSASESQQGIQENPKGDLADSPIDSPEDSITLDKNHFTVLLVGVDRRAGEKSMSNTDTLLMASINTISGKVALLSIPRDTQVSIPGYGKEKINAAARLGKGLSTTKSLIETLTGQKINGYVLTNFSGFKSMIDTLGGIVLTVEKDMHYMTGDKEDGVIDLHKGTQRLNGKQALQYARFRQDALGDITRANRQQAVIKAMEKELLQIKSVPKLPSLITQMDKCVETDLSVGQLWSLANLMIRNDKLDITSQTLPGNFLIENTISYWKVNPQKAKVVVRRLLDEGKTSSVFFNSSTEQD